MGLFSKRKDNKIESVTSNNQENQITEAEKLFEAGKSYENSNPKLAFSYFLKAAEKGHVNAMSRVGRAYLYQGQGAEFDINKSASWYEKGAEGGHPGCMLSMAMFYMAGIGAAQDDNKAKYWLRKALESGNERMASIAQEYLDDYESNKIAYNALMTTAVNMNGIPPLK